MIPPEQNANFVAKMTGVLSVYKRPHNPKRPVVCMDEMPRQLIREVRKPLPMETGKPERHDYHYKRNGVVNLFMFFEPLAGWRTVMTRERRTKIDWAHCMRQLLEKHYPDTEKVILVMDNLCAYGLSSFYEAFPPEEACRLAQRLEIHYTLWARQLAEHGGDRKQRDGPPVPFQADSRETVHGRRNVGLVRAAQQSGNGGRLAVSNRRCTHQTAETLPKH
ncbi:transposase [Salinibacter ruber]|uniref:transposase n=1 Tax=Salinibacter ruber TaxID=146919 RepID=UPI000E57B5EB|nr:transposase [Salinibacter ruber]